MSNNISLTIRLPHELSEQLKQTSKQLGTTRTGLIRSAIHDFLTKDEIVLDFSSTYSDKSDRLTLNVNQVTRDILENACLKYNQSANAVVIALSALILERSAKWLQLAGN